MPAHKLRADLPVRILSIVVFLLGIGLLLAVFALAWRLFTSPVPGLGLPIAAGSPAPAPAAIGAAIFTFVKQIVFMAIMIISGSLIAGRGIHLYFTNAAHATVETGSTSAKNGMVSGEAPVTAQSKPIPTPPGAH